MLSPAVAPATAVLLTITGDLFKASYRAVTEGPLFHSITISV